MTQASPKTIYIAPCDAWKYSQRDAKRQLGTAVGDPCAEYVLKQAVDANILPSLSAAMSDYIDAMPGNDSAADHAKVLRDALIENGLDVIAVDAPVLQERRVMDTTYNLSEWIKRREKDIGCYAETIISGVEEYERQLNSMQAPLPPTGETK